MTWLLSELQSIVEKLHVPLSGFGILRLFLVLLGSLLLLAILEWRFQALTRFRSEKSTALNLAIVRIVVAANLLWQIRLHEILVTMSLDPVLRVPFRIWGGLASHLAAPPAYITAIYAVFEVSAFLMLIGLFGRVASAVCAVSATYLVSFLFLYGKVDHIYNHLVFFSAVCALFPSTDTLSMDAVLTAWREADGGRLLRSKPGRSYGSALRYMWIFVGLVYYFPGLWKFSRNWLSWISGNALRDNIALAGDRMSWTPLQGWLLRHPLSMSAGNILVLVFELGFIFVILFRRFRPFAGILGLVFHTATKLVLGISFISLETCYVVFFDWTAIFSWISRKLTLGRATVLYDSHCKLCRRAAGTLAIFDWTNSLTFVPNTAAPTLPLPMRLHLPEEPERYFSVITDAGRAGIGYEGYKLVAARLPLLWPLRPFMALPGVRQLGTAIYERVARSRACNILDQTSASGERLLPALVPPSARGLPLAGLAVRVILGLLHVVDTWPLGCFPTFDGPTSEYITQLSVQILDAANIVQDWNLSSDPKSRRAYPRWRWLANQGKSAGLGNRPKAAAVVNLWLKCHPELHVRNVAVYVETYQMRPLEGTRVRVARRKTWEFAF